MKTDEELKIFKNTVLSEYFMKKNEKNENEIFRMEP